MTAIPLPESRAYVVFRHDKIGDLIVSTPLFDVIRANDPAARVILVASPYNAAIAAGHPSIDEVWTYDKAWPLARRLGVLRLLRAARPEAAFVLAPRNDAYFMAWLSGARRRGGILMSYRLLPRLLAPLLLTAAEGIDRAADRRAGRPSRHQTEIVLALAAKLGLAVRGAPPLSLPPPGPGPLARLGLGAGPSLVLHMVGAWLSHGWTLDDMRGLIRGLAALGAGRVVLTLGPQDHAAFAPLVAECPALTAGPDGAYAETPPAEGSDLPAIAVRTPPFADWSALIAEASLVVTQDCGAVHLAAAHGTPVVVVYAPGRFETFYAEFGPWQVPNRGLEKSAPEATGGAILEAAAALLAEGRRAARPACGN